MIPVKVSVNKNQIVFRTGDDKVVYETDVNTFLENTGITVKNVRIPFSSERIFYIPLVDLGETLNCGRSFENAIFELEREEYSGLLIIDFSDITEVSQQFFKKYTQFLLETSNKVITINMNTEISTAFSLYISSNLLKKVEEEEE